jgi:L-seryl-tRNA(Ser) seleniumtransferase
VDDVTARSDPRRDLPSVDRLLETDRVAAWSERWGREPVKGALRAALAAARRRVDAGGEAGGVPDTEALLEEAGARLRRSARSSLRPVLNGTGVVLHTNLGRAPLAAEALEAVSEVGAGYSNLEFDLEAGERGSRYEHCAELLCEVTGAPAALLVNNNAAAVALAVNELAREKEVVVSRGEMVEIGGSFRIPDVVRRSGGVLRGVGTTNRTRISDYREAVGAETGMILKVHPSNYEVHGFTARAELSELVELGRDLDVPVAHDLGSGLLSPGVLEGFPPEPSPSRSVDAGADLVTWSGDKLLGGPQAGVVLGSEEMISRLRTNPLLRAFRVDKMTLAAMEATLRLHRDPGLSARRVPALRALTERPGEVEARAREALSGARETGDVAADLPVEVRPMHAVVGGGAYPGFRLESAGWVVAGVDADALDAACRASDPPLVGRIREGEFRVDVRTLLPGQEEDALRILGSALEGLEG